jgi:hypothetical protein
MLGFSLFSGIQRAGDKRIIDFIVTMINHDAWSLTFTIDFSGTFGLNNDAALGGGVAMQCNFFFIGLTGIQLVVAPYFGADEAKYY